LIARNDFIDQAPCLGFTDIKPPPSQKQFHRDVVGDALGQFHTCGIGYGARSDLGQGKGGVIGGKDHIGAQRQFQPATTGNTIYGSNDRLVQITPFLHAAKPANAIIAIYCIAISSGFEIPTGAKEFLAAACDDGHAQVWIIAETCKHFTHKA
jgi:hypothetical protein